MDTEYQEFILENVFVWLYLFPDISLRDYYPNIIYSNTYKHSTKYVY